MAIGHALYEEMQFDESSVTSRDWRTYPIATMADVPEMKVVIISKPEVGRYGTVPRLRTPPPWRPLPRHSSTLRARCRGGCRSRQRTCRAC